MPVFNSKSTDTNKLPTQQHRINVPCIHSQAMSSRSMTMSCYANVFSIIGPLWGGSSCHRGITLCRAIDVETFFVVSLNKLLNQSRCPWFKTPLRSCHKHCNVYKDSRVLSAANMPQTRTSVFHIWYHFTYMAELFSCYRMFYISLHTTIHA